MFGLLSAIAIGAGMGYARKTVSRIDHTEKLSRAHDRCIAGKNRQLMIEVGNIRALDKALCGPISDDVKAILKEKLAKHELHARCLKAQIDELSVPVVFPV